MIGGYYKIGIIWGLFLQKKAQDVLILIWLKN